MSADNSQKRAKAQLKTEKIAVRVFIQFNYKALIDKSSISHAPSEAFQHVYSVIIHFIDMQNTF